MEREWGLTGEIMSETIKVGEGERRRIVALGIQKYGRNRKSKFRIVVLGIAVLLVIGGKLSSSSLLGGMGEPFDCAELDAPGWADSEDSQD